MQPKTGVTFRFRSWVLVPTDDHWSGWTHCDRNTMLEFVRVTARIDEYSQARSHPEYGEKYRALEEVQVITWTGDMFDEWRWTPRDGWQPKPLDEYGLSKFEEVPRPRRHKRKEVEDMEAECREYEETVHGRITDG